MERKIGIALIAGAIAFAILQFGMGTSEFRQGLDVQQLKENATLVATVGGLIVTGLVLAFSGNPTSNNRS